MKDKPSIAMIVAMSENRVIGKNNALPWHLPADLAFFKKTTLGHPVIMGRKTYQSIGRLLPGRRNLILTRDASFHIDNADIFSSVSEAIASCSNSGIVIAGVNPVHLNELRTSLPALTHKTLKVQSY